MNLKTAVLSASVAGAMVFGATKSALAQSPYPLVKLSISGTVSYSPNYQNGLSLEVPLKTASYNNDTLVSLLNASPSAANDIHTYTGTNQIPKSSYFLWDPSSDGLYITNKNGFFFPLNPNDGTHNWDYGYLEINSSQLIGTYTVKTNLSGTETDRTGIYFYFDDGANYSTQIELYGTGTLNWTLGTATGNTQKATLSVSISGISDGGSSVLSDFEGVTASFSASGSGTLTNLDVSTVPIFYNY